MSELAVAEPLGNLKKKYDQEQNGQFQGPSADRASQRLSTSSVSDLDMTPSMR